MPCFCDYSYVWEKDWSSPTTYHRYHHSWQLRVSLHIWFRNNLVHAQIVYLSIVAIAESQYDLEQWQRRSWVPVIWHKTAHASLGGGGIFRAWWALTTRWNKSDYSVLMFFGDLVQLISHCPSPITMANAFLRLKTCLIHDATDITCTARVSWLILQQSLYMSSMSSRRHRSKYINYRYRWTFLQFGCAPATL